MKHLKITGLIVAVIIFLLTVVGINFNTLGELVHSEPLTPALTTAVIDAGILTVFKIIVLLYGIYYCLLELYNRHYKNKQEQELFDKIERIIGKHNLKKEQASKPEPVKDIDLNCLAREAEFEPTKKVIKPLRDNYDNIEEYYKDIVEYYKVVGEDEFRIAVELSTNWIYVKDSIQLDVTVATCSRNIGIREALIKEIILDSFCIEQVKLAYEESLKGKN
jgi:hypothetical protein